MSNGKGYKWMCRKEKKSSKNGPCELSQAKPRCGVMRLLVWRIMGQWAQPMFGLQRPTHVSDSFQLNLLHSHARTLAPAISLAIDVECFYERLILRTRVLVILESRQMFATVTGFDRLRHAPS